MGDTARCVCGHVREAHVHHRPGSDCGCCGRARCKAYRCGASTAASGRQAGVPASMRVTTRLRRARLR